MPNNLSFLGATDFVIVTPEFKEKCGKELISFIEITPGFEKTYLIIVAVNRDNKLNSVIPIACKKGIPIGGFLYNTKTDSYEMECVDYLNLGYITASYFAIIKELQWKIRIPMTEKIIKKYLTSMQKKELKNFKIRFKPAEHDFVFVQMIDPN